MTDLRQGRLRNGSGDVTLRPETLALKLVLGTGSPKPEVFERQIDAALALLGTTAHRRRQ